MSIFSKWFKKKNEEVVEAAHELEAVSEPLSEIEVSHVEDKIKTMSNESERYGPRVVDEEVSVAEIKIPWGKPRAEMSADELDAIREYDRNWYANNRAKKSKRNEDYALDITGATANV